MIRIVLGRAAQVRAQIDAALVAEARDRRAIRGIDRVDETCRRAEQAALFAVGPPRQPARRRRRADAGIEGPLLAAGGRVERDDFLTRRHHVHGAVDDEWRRLQAACVRRLESPDLLEAADVRLGDLAERGDNACRHDRRRRRTSSRPRETAPVPPASPPGTPGPPDHPFTHRILHTPTGFTCLTGLRIIQRRCDSRKGMARAMARTDFTTRTLCGRRGGLRGARRARDRCDRCGTDAAATGFGGTAGRLGPGLPVSMESAGERAHGTCGPGRRSSG